MFPMKNQDFLAVRQPGRHTAAATRLVVAAAFFLVFVVATARSNQNVWTWVSGTDQPNSSGMYAVKGVANATSLPAARSAASGWFNPRTRDFYIFGGQSMTSPTIYFNDLWKFNTINSTWTWISGGDGSSSNFGIYGSMGSGNSSTCPGSRMGHAYWYDPDENVAWIFGGYGSAVESPPPGLGSINDLWKFDLNTSIWTWVGGPSEYNNYGNATQQGVPDPFAIPGGRRWSQFWFNSTSSELYLFGGNINAPTNWYYGNDFWKFNTKDSVWTWLSGSSLANALPVYGVRGISSPTNDPGALFGAAVYYDDTRKVAWMFGGSNVNGAYNTLWRYDGSWTWVSGSTSAGSVGVYGTMGVPSSSNMPGARRDTVLFFDSSSNSLWLFGGLGMSSVASQGRMNDLWMYNVGLDQWTWVGGSNIVGTLGSFGTKGVASYSSWPNARSSGVFARDEQSENTWIFGGIGVINNVIAGLADAWKLEEVCRCPAGSACDHYESACPTVNCTGLSSGWLTNSTCGAWADTLPGRCKQGSCNTDVMIRCAAESQVTGIGRPSCGSASCRLTCAVGSPASLSAAVKDVCGLSQVCEGSGTCDIAGTCVLAVASGGNVGVAVGVSIAVVAVVAIIIAVLFLVMKRRRKDQAVALNSIPDDVKHLFLVKGSDLKYEEAVGEGSYGVVYRGSYNGERVAVKKLTSVTATAAGEFFRESSVMMGAKHHPNLVKLIGMCQVAGQFSLVMEYLPNGSLESYMKKTGKPFEDPMLRRLAQGIASGMVSLASQNICHRDLACRNILLTADMTPKISDFGFARVVGEEGEGKTATMVGPIRWMSPESIREHRFSEKSDVWSFGCVLLELCTAQQPYAHMDVFTVAVKLRDEGTSPKVPANAPDWAQNLMARCWQLRPENRPTFSKIYEILSNTGYTDFPSN